jgi:broad specificity phosphatase PhoE
MVSTAFLLIRHCHTASDWIGPQTPFSDGSDAGLDELGQWQAQRLAQRLRWHADDLSLYTSPAPAAVATADAIAHRRRGVSAEVDLDLRAMNCGNVQGLSLSEVRRRFPEVWADSLRRANDFRWPGGEAYAELRARAVGCLERLTATAVARSVVIVSHSGVISQIVGSIVGTPPAFWGHHRPSSGSITTLSYCNGKHHLLSFDDHGHL